MLSQWCLAQLIDLGDINILQWLSDNKLLEVTGWKSDHTLDSVGTWKQLYYWAENYSFN